MADWKDRLGVLYSTNPDFEYTTEQVEEPDTLEPARQELRISLSKKQRGGKEVTLITGFVGREEDLAELGRLLRQRCGVGGSAKDGEILIQGDQRTKLRSLLPSLGYTRTKG
ncbi:translation initiation factor [uncultured Porphyromonas sp.]|uniref:translation initiation factor n=1 Tax=uncultured Porphyromonas sp. TaxID=159274 RepID=UPI001CAD256E|nr:translation initiation factor [uncultured Porphyromonas sp.]MBF1047481.1 translation initiation factor [Porphyromonadaceae bacterium]